MELVKQPGGQLCTQADCTVAGGAAGYTDPLPFIVDPASDRTLIVPDWIPEFSRSGIEPEDKIHSDDTLIGRVEYRLARGIDFQFAGADFESTLTIRLDSVAFVVPGQQFTGGEFDGIDDPGERTPFNVLGLDMLGHFTIVCEAGPDGKAYLIHGFPLLLHELKDHRLLRGAFEPKTLPEVRVERPKPGAPEAASVERELALAPHTDRLPAWFRAAIEQGARVDTKFRGKDRRAEPRRRCAIDCVARPEPSSVRVVDVCSRGVRFVTKGDLAVGQLVWLTSPGKTQEKPVRARVVYSRTTALGRAISCRLVVD